MPQGGEPSSPRVAALTRELESGNTDALGAFWRAVEREGTPLVEPIPGDDTAYLVTFLWRDDSADLRNVVACSHALGWSFVRNQMTRLPGSDVWYHTYRLPAATRTGYWLSPNDSLVYLLDMQDRAERMATWVADPLNRTPFVFPKDEDDPDDKEALHSMIVLPGAPAQPWAEARSAVPAGHVEKDHIRSDILGNERRVWVYTPPGYTPHTPAGTPSAATSGDAADRGQDYTLLVVFDGWAYLRLVPTPTILDNLLAAGKVPPVVAVLVDSLSTEERNRELPCYPPFADFLARELLPWVCERYAVTTDPARTIVAGSSYGGLAAAYAGWRLPGMCGNILSQSGAFWWRPEGDHEHEWLIHQFVADPRLPLRFYLDAGSFENGFQDPGILVANRHLRDVLRAKGYPLTYAEYTGGHDYACWRGTLADGLMALIGADAV
jgi:enterochelin esterase family protein